jgi:hypothetical protein
MRRLALEIIAHSLEATQLADLLADFKKVQFDTSSILSVPYCSIPDWYDFHYYTVLSISILLLASA